MWGYLNGSQNHSIGNDEYGNHKSTVLVNGDYEIMALTRKYGMQAMKKYLYLIGGIKTSIVQRKQSKHLVNMSGLIKILNGTLIEEMETRKKFLMIVFKLPEHNLLSALNVVLGVAVLGLSRPLNYTSSIYAISLMRFGVPCEKTGLAGLI